LLGKWIYCYSNYIFIIHIVLLIHELPGYVQLRQPSFTFIGYTFHLNYLSIAFWNDFKVGILPAWAEM